MRTSFLAKKISTFLNKDETVLDIGAGEGLIGQYLNDSLGFKIEMIDVANHNRSRLPILVYDGKKLPFERDSFDCVLLIFVLHHAKDKKALTEEAIRVARKRIIVVEDTPESKTGKFFWLVFERLVNFNIAHSAGTQTRAEWREYFNRMGLRAV